MVPEGGQRRWSGQTPRSPMHVALTDIRLFAAPGGHLHILKFATLHNEAWELWCWTFAQRISSPCEQDFFARLACANGDNETIEWVASLPSTKLSADVWLRAVQNLDLHVMKFLWRERGLRSPWHLAFNGRLFNEETEERLEVNLLGYDDNIWKRGLETVVRLSTMSDGWSSQKVVDVLQWMLQQGITTGANGQDRIDGENFKPKKKRKQRVPGSTRRISVLASVRSWLPPWCFCGGWRTVSLGLFAAKCKRMGIRAMLSGT